MIDLATLSVEQAALIDALLADAAADAPRGLGGSAEPRAVCIRTGADRAPLFVIHGSGGRVLFLHALARHLPAEQPVYGIEAATDDSAEDAAHLRLGYAEAIRAVRPNGPYRIGGYSAGCLVAFAVAALLEVEFLLLIDPASVPDPGDNAIPAGDARQRLGKRLEMARLAGVTPLSPEFSQIARVNRALARIVGDFCAEPIAGRIHLIHGTRGDYVPSPVTLAQWAHLTRGGMERAAIEADHFEIVRDPHAATTAGYIQTWLNRLDGRA